MGTTPGGSPFDPPHEGPGQAGGGQGWGGPPPPAWGTPAGQQPGYPASAGGYGAPPIQQTNGLAIGALVCSILGFFCGVGFLIGLILGYVARGQIRASHGAQGGEGVALAAIIIGWIGVGLIALLVLFVVAVLGGLAIGV